MVKLKIIVDYLDFNHGSIIRWHPKSMISADPTAKRRAITWCHSNLITICFNAFLRLLLDTIVYLLMCLRLVVCMREMIS
jgi:hypothetical protein